MEYQIQNGTVLISPEDKEILDLYKWRIDDYGYAITSIYIRHQKKTKTLRMHQFLLQPEKGLVVDHIDRRPHNNQRSNLRVITYRENWYNSTRADKYFSRGVLKDTETYLLVNTQ